MFAIACQPAAAPPPANPIATIPQSSTLIVSRNVPIYTTNEIYPPQQGNNPSYSDQARCAIPCYLALDLNSAGALGRVQVAWYSIGNGFLHTLLREPGYNLPSSYTFDANASTSKALPTSGWVTLATVAGDHYSGRQFNLDLTSYHWLRMNITAADGGDAAVQIDVQTGPNDSWFFGGDSITSDAMTLDESYQGTLTPTKPNFPQQINAAFPNHFPLQIDAGIGGITATVVAGTYQLSGVKGGGHDYMKDWMAAFPSRYVTLNYGSNDAAGEPVADFYQAMDILVRDVLAAGRIPIVPTIPWRCSADVSPYNEQIRALYTAHPEVVHGPDLFALWKDSPDIKGNDCIHPRYPTGMATYRTQWASWAIANIYK